MKIRVLITVFFTSIFNTAFSEDITIQQPEFIWTLKTDRIANDPTIPTNKKSQIMILFKTLKDTEVKPVFWEKSIANGLDIQVDLFWKIFLKSDQDIDSDELPFNFILDFGLTGPNSNVKIAIGLHENGDPVEVRLIADSDDKITCFGRSKCAIENQKQIVDKIQIPMGKSRVYSWGHLKKMREFSDLTPFLGLPEMKAEILKYVIDSTPVHFEYHPHKLPLQ
jgi:hypothetical protein